VSADPQSLKTSLLAVNDAAIDRAAELMTHGQLVAFPTETVYGLGSRADDGTAVRRIYAAKGRPATKPLSVLVPSVAKARAAALHWSDLADHLAKTFWPGPLTLVVLRGPLVADDVVAGGKTVALRVPHHDAALRLLRACPFPIAAPSANLSGQPPATSAKEAMDSLGGRIALVLDGGATPVQTPSTVLDLTGCEGRGKILRHGAISAAELGQHIELA
jgi:L-threonylcarbamoyladenylate synthase